MPGEKGAATHYVQVEEGRESGKDADRESDLSGNGCSGGAMGEPVESLGKPGNAEDNGCIAEHAGAKPQSSLLHAGIEAGREGDVDYFDQNNGEAATQAGTRQSCQVHNRSCSRAQQGTLPIPAGKCPRDEGRTAGWGHAFIMKS